MKAVQNLLLLVAVACLIQGCASMTEKMARPIVGGLETALLQQEDVDTVTQGLPTMLLLLDGFIVSSPENNGLLSAAANMNGSFAGLIESEKRQKIASKKAMAYAIRSCELSYAGCKNKIYGELAVFYDFIDGMTYEDLPLMYSILSAWTSYLQAHTSDWDVVAQIPRIEKIAKKIIEFNEYYEYGFAHTLLGVLKTLVPPAMGGKPEVGKIHFEKAIEINKGHYLPSLVFYAKYYARLMFEKNLHDMLLKRVVEAPNDILPNLVLVNMVAKKQAQVLLLESDEYF